jgi:hypothetical protein
MDSTNSLASAVVDFASLTCDLTDADLEKPWVWRDYDEGVRFAFFRTYEDLRTLAVRLAAGRSASGEEITQAQRILGQVHAAYRDLQAVLLGWTAQQLEQSPGGEEWPARTALQHIISAERSFYFTIHFALLDSRLGNTQPTELTEAIWDEFWAGDSYSGLRENGTALELQTYYALLHQRVLDGFVSITASELEAPAVFWEAQPYPLRFRLHRFDSHLRQHTIQIEKTLLAVGLPHNEARRLLRLIFNALAEVEGVMLGSQQGAQACQLLADEIRKRSAEIAKTLAA